jgi:hypothetical protein
MSCHTFGRFPFMLNGRAAGHSCVFWLLEMSTPNNLETDLAVDKCQNRRVKVICLGVDFNQGEEITLFPLQLPVLSPFCNNEYYDTGNNTHNTNHLDYDTTKKTH